MARLQLVLMLMAASSIKQVQHEQRPDPQVKSSWLLERTEEIMTMSEEHN